MQTTLCRHVTVTAPAAEYSYAGGAEPVGHKQICVQAGRGVAVWGGGGVDGVLATGK